MCFLFYRCKFLIDSNSEKKLTYKITSDRACKERERIRLYLLNAIYGFKIGGKKDQSKLYKQLEKTDFEKYSVYKDNLTKSDSIIVLF